jgi:hypothetical protein
MIVDCLTNGMNTLIEVEVEGDHIDYDESEISLTQLVERYAGRIYNLCLGSLAILRSPRISLRVCF